MDVFHQFNVKSFAQRMAIGLLLAACVQRGASAAAATLEEVDAEIGKINETLKVAGDSKETAAQRATTLSAAVDKLHAVCEMVEKIPNLTPDERDKKTTEVMSMIFWCKKMMPLDLSGGSLPVAKPAGGPPPSDAGGAPAAKLEKTPDLDEVLFNRAKAYAVAHPHDLEGIMTRYQNVATSYPGSHCGQQSANEAKQARVKLDADRRTQKPIMDRVEKMELDDVLQMLGKQLVTETDAVKKASLAQTKKDIETIQTVFNKYLQYQESKQIPMTIAFEELGLNRKGWIKKAGKAGIFYTTENKDAAPGGAPLPWESFGAKSSMRLIYKTLAINDAETLAQLGIACTVCEEYVSAEECFARILRVAPDKTKDLVGYFIRAQFGYESSGEAIAQSRFTEAKNLLRDRKFKEGMAAISELLKDLSMNSSQTTMLKELNRFRAASCRQYQIDDSGNPITPFEKVVRNMYFGDIKIDEATGAIEANYDFSTPDQFRDWIQSEGYPKASTRVDWTLQNGKLTCSGQGLMLAWRFPLSEFSMTADVTYQDASKKVIVYSGLTREKPLGVWGQCRDGEAHIGKTPRITDAGNWYSSVRFIWRPNESATIRWSYLPDEPYPFILSVNNREVISGREPYTNGGIGFNFEAGGKGTISNIQIKGKIDIAAFKTQLASGQ